MNENIIQVKLLHPINQCIAKTHSGHRCKKKPMSKHFLCSQHNKITASFFKNLNCNSQINLSTQQNGGDPLTDFYRSIFSVMIPSCLDILQCDWITDITYAIPGLSLVLKLMSY